MTRVQGPKGAMGKNRLPLNPTGCKNTVLPSPPDRSGPSLLLFFPLSLFLLSLLDFFSLSLSLSLFPYSISSSSSPPPFFLHPSPSTIHSSSLSLSLSLNLVLHIIKSPSFSRSSPYSVLPSPLHLPSTTTTTPPPPLHIATLFPPFYSVPFRVSTFKIY